MYFENSLMVYKGNTKKLIILQMRRSTTNVFEAG